MSLKVFYSYSHQDEALRDRLEKALAGLRHEGLIESWHDRRIGAGEDWREQIDKHINSADIILLLVSPDFIASDYCYGIEVQVALKRHAEGNARVIPIILQPVDWSGAPFAKLQGLPRNGKPVALWPNRNQALADVAQGIRQVIHEFQRRGPPESRNAATVPDESPQSRVLDAALPSRIMQNRATELLVLIRLPNSPGLKGVLAEDEDAESQPRDVRSKPFELTFPLGRAGKPEPVKVVVEITSLDFEPASQLKSIVVPVNANSETCAFMLKPQRTGQLTVIVELQWEDTQRGHRRLRTNCLANLGTEEVRPPMNVVNMPIVLLIPALSIPAQSTSPSATSVDSPQTESPRESKRAGRLTRILGAPLLVALIGLATVLISKWPFPPYDRESGPAITAPFDVRSFFQPGDFMGDGEYGREYVEINEAYTGHPRLGDQDGLCTRVEYKKQGDKGFAGVYWTWPDHNWGDARGRRVVGATKISFWAAGEAGGEVVEFKAGGVRSQGKAFFDTFQAAERGPRPLMKEWKRVEISVAGKDLGDVIGAFEWNAASNWNRLPLIFYLDDIRYE